MSGLQDGKYIKDSTLTKAKLNLVSATGGNDPVIKTDHDAAMATLNAAINNSIQNRDWKDSVRVASTGNVNISNPGTAVFDGVTLTTGDRILLKNQSTASQNGIYVFATSSTALTRATDADASADVTSGMAMLVEEGTANGGTTWRLSTTGTIVLGTTSLTFVAFATITAPVPTTQNKFMTASATTSDGDAACATGLSSTPAQNSYVHVVISGGFIPEIGNGVKTKDAYFSGDSGSTARAFNAIVSGDKLYWNGSIAGVQLATTDLVSFHYNV